MSESAVLGLVTACILFGGLCGFLFGAGATAKSWQAQCVERGVAEYNQTTGDWQWKEVPSE